MIQQINLYEKTLREESDAFSAVTLAGGFGVVLAGLVAISGFAWWRVATVGRELHALQAQAERRSDMVAKGQLVASSGDTGQALESRLRTMAIALDRRQRALRYLQSGAAGTESGFSARLEALAREQVDGLWLSGVILTGDSARFELTGKALHAALVPIYLSKLAAEPALAGTKLQLLEIRAPKSGDTVDFTVSSGSGDHSGKEPQRTMDARFAMTAVAAGTAPR